MECAPALLAGGALLALLLLLLLLPCRLALLGLPLRLLLCCLGTSGLQSVDLRVQPGQAEGGRCSRQVIMLLWWFE